MHEVYRVFDIVVQEPPAGGLSDAIVTAHNHVRQIDGVSVEWAAHNRIRLRFDEHVGAHNIMLDIMDKLSALGYK